MIVLVNLQLGLKKKKKKKGSTLLSLLYYYGLSFVTCSSDVSQIGIIINDGVLLKRRGERSLCLTALHDKPVSFLFSDTSSCIDSQQHVRIVQGTDAVSYAIGLASTGTGKCSHFAIQDDVAVSFSGVLGKGKCSYVLCRPQARMKLCSEEIIEVRLCKNQMSESQLCRFGYNVSLPLHRHSSSRPV